MIEFSEQSNLNLWLKIKYKFNNNITYRVSTIMLFFGILTNIVLFSLINVNISVIDDHWKVISGFNLGFAGGFLGFLLLSWSSSGLFSKVPFKKALAYFMFLIRILIYGVIIGLAIYFKFFNLISIIAGFSLLLVAVLTSEFILLRKAKKEKNKC